LEAARNVVNTKESVTGLMDYFLVFDGANTYQLINNGLNV
jgi:hypothetical protein